MIEANSKVSIRRQCELLGFSRANYYCEVKDKTNITYIKLKKGSMYLTAIKDVYSSKLLSWELSNTRYKFLFIGTAKSNKELWSARDI